MTGTSIEAAPAPSTVETFVRDWQVPVWNFALRMLGNAADAADATQETFAAILRGFAKYDPLRPAGPWVMSIAANTTRNFLRRRDLRRKKEEAAAEKRHDVLMSNPAPQLSEREIAAALADLDADDRSIILMHFFGGLSQDETAEAMAIPRSTLRSRLKNAIERMRRHLTAAGVAPGVIAQLEPLFSATPPIAVPAHVATTLAKLASEFSAAGSLATGTALGGLIVTKKIIGIAALTAIFSLGLGYIFGTAGAGKDDADLAAIKIERDALADARAEIEKLRTAQEATQRRLEKAESDAAVGKKDLAAATAKLLAAEKAAASRETPVAQKSDDTAKTDVSAELDWSKFADLLTKNFDLLQKVASGSDDLTADEQRAFGDIANEGIRLGRLALALSDQPIFDSRVMPGVIEAFFGKTMKMTPEALENLRARTISILQAKKTSVDVDNALPIDLYRARQDLIASIADATEAQVSPEDRARWDAVRRVASQMLSGSSATLDMGLFGDAATAEEAQAIVDHWNRSYSFSAEQREKAAAAATKFADDARAVLRRYGQFGTNLPAPTAEVAAQIDADMYSLHKMREAAFQDILTADQKQRARRRPPTIFKFGYGQNRNINISQRPGF